MPFRLWYYAVKLGVVLLAILLVARVFFPSNRIATIVGACALVALLLLGFAGGVMGFLMTLGKLRMKCPFCGIYGEPLVDPRGVSMLCETCGVIRGRSAFRCSLVRQARTNSLDESEVPIDAMEPLFLEGWKYFRRWRTLWWYVAMVIPLVAGVMRLVFRGRTAGAIGILMLGLIIAAVLFVFLCSGRTSSNWGTFYRQREPRKFWMDALILGAVYVGIVLVPWLAK